MPSYGLLEGRYQFDGWGRYPTNKATSTFGIAAVPERLLNIGLRCARVELPPAVPPILERSRKAGAKAAAIVRPDVRFGIRPVLTDLHFVSSGPATIVEEPLISSNGIAADYRGDFVLHFRWHASSPLITSARLRNVRVHMSSFNDAGGPSLLFELGSDQANVLPRIRYISFTVVYANLQPAENGLVTFSYVDVNSSMSLVEA